ncbi:MAG: hypothetical protein QOG02_2030 [Gaiellales bacterium]|nr:hypothetical protein [Gaiellales bacterium]MDX6546256.1 hypothetical protein [Gaiellales bacterium]
MSVVAPAPAAPPRPRRRTTQPTPAPRRERARAARPSLARPRSRRFPVTPGVMWVLLLATLFGGIVALNVGALRSSIEASRLDGQAAALRSQNADFESQISAQSGYGRISQLARGYGMVQVQPSRRNFIMLHPGKASTAASTPTRHARFAGGTAPVKRTR